MTDTDMTTPVEFQGEPLWDRFQSFLSQVCEGDYEFTLAPSLGVEGQEIRVTREVRHGLYGLDSTIGSCLFGLACDIHDLFPRGNLLFASPSEWMWCVQHQFVEEPLRFFFERSGMEWNLNMAVLVTLERT